MHVPAPAALASDWQWASAPAIPPRSAPLPMPTLVTKKLILAGGDYASAPTLPRDKATAVRNADRIVRLMSLPFAR